MGKLNQLIIAICIVLSGGCLVIVSAAADEILVVRDKNGKMTFTNRSSVSAKLAGNGAKVEAFNPGRGAYTLSRNRRRMANVSRLFHSRFHELIVEAAQHNNLDVSLIKAVIHAESGFDQHAVSPKGAQGLMQLMPGTARMLRVKNSFTPRENIRGGASYLAALLGKFSGDLKLALAAYNAGEENVRKYKGIPPFPETQNYVRRVLALKSRYSSAR